MFADGCAITRRQLLMAAAAAPVGLFARRLEARGRVVPGGHLAMTVPWPVASVDPHRLDDPAAMLFGAALFDGLFTLDAAGAVAPALAETLPEVTARGAKVVLREGVRFASGRRMTAHDVVHSIDRARALGNKGWLEPLGVVRAVGTGEVTFTGKNVDRIARALASPLAAVVPVGFTPERPDGTGPFVADVALDGARLTLRTNRLAASGPAFLDRVVVNAAPDLAVSLRAFESGEDDLGWLGLGLHEPRRGAVPFDAGAVGWAILRVGEQARSWSLPGVAERLADGIDPARLAQLGVTAAAPFEPDEGWGGPPAALMVRGDAPWLVELARAVAAALSREGHEVTATPVTRAELDAAHASGAYALAVDVARPYDATPLGAYVALASADDPVRGAELARHPPLGAADSPRAMARFLRVGVLAEVHFKGGKMPDLALPLLPSGAGVDLASISRPPSGVP